MCHPNTLLRTILLAVGFVLIFADVAHAYIDPGTGSFFLQAMFASLVGMALFLKVFWQSIKMFLYQTILRRTKKKV